MLHLYYILDEAGEPVAMDDVVAWGLWFEAHPDERGLARDRVRDDVEISTVFLGLDHSFLPSGPPVLWETMIFGGPDDQAQWRHTSRGHALAFHQELVARAERHESLSVVQGETE